MHKEKQEILDNNKKEIDKGEERGLSESRKEGEGGKEKGGKGEVCARRRKVKVQGGMQE